jgi:ABC-type proline/glycine betaine transport system ATPase subunit
VGDPDLIIDEPAEGLAPLLVRQVGDLITEIARRDVAILLVEQKLSIALDISARLYVMGHGTIVFEGTPAEFKAAADVRREWLEVTGIAAVPVRSAVLRPLATLHRQSVRVTGHRNDDAMLSRVHAGLRVDRRPVRMTPVIESAARCRRRFGWINSVGDWRPDQFFARALLSFLLFDTAETLVKLSCPSRNFELKNRPESRSWLPS